MTSLSPILIAVEHVLGPVVLGAACACYGTIIGAGGGFVLMPLLLLMYPADPPELLTGVSLTVVFANAASGAQAYARQRRIDYRAGLLFAAAALPGAVAGAFATALLPRRTFDMVFGLCMMSLAAFMLLRAPPENRAFDGADPSRVHTVHDREGHVYTYVFQAAKGTWLSLGVGFASSFLGIGGGIIHVPAMVYWLGMPVHVATATSHFILAIMSLAGALAHMEQGYFAAVAHKSAFLALGALGGAQVGARLANRVKGRFIILGLAGALILAGARILWLGVQS